MQISTTLSSPQHSMVRIPKATAPVLSFPQPYRSSAAKSPVGSKPLFRVQPGEPDPGLGPETYAYPAKRYTFSYTRMGMAGSPWISRTGDGDVYVYVYVYEQVYVYVYEQNAGNRGRGRYRNRDRWIA
jgi:hypothetical protein